MKQIDIDGLSIKLKKHHKSKQLRLKVRSAQATVTMPRRVPYKVAAKFARSHADWIRQQLAEQHPLSSPTNQQRRQARDVAERLVRLHAERMGLEHKNISIRNQSTRWGSCSSQGNLSFNWRIILLPSELQHYLVIHELAHLQHPNHSSDYWQLVGKFDDKYTSHRQQLRQIDLMTLEG